jgi:3-hydroxybutyryl-CoA dehydrogenase
VSERVTLPEKASVVGVVGAGAMGSGIAQVAAAAGHHVVLADAMTGAVARARSNMTSALTKLVEKGKITADNRDALVGRIEFHEGPLEDDLGAYRECGLVIEAVVEDLAVKQQLFARLEKVVPDDAVLATNTSSLSVGAIASACGRSERVLGVHFFNPAPVMPLVEIVPWLASDPAVVQATHALVAGWGKTAVLASDTPGFIVNRVARPFYGEALRLYDEGVADFATIDWAMKELGGFRMGPFELMDFIGNDVNYAVTLSVYDAFFGDPRYKPSLTQKRLVDAGFYGRKAGRGYYDYRDGAVKPEPTRDQALGRAILDRILAMLVNEAVDAVFWRVASPSDVDLAMTRGVNYPKGLLAWGEEIGFATVLAWLKGLQEEYGEDRYRPSPLLARIVRQGRGFFV